MFVNSFCWLDFRRCEKRLKRSLIFSSENIKDPVEAHKLMFSGGIKVCGNTIIG